MSYSAVNQQRSPFGATPSCMSKQAWIKAQLACNSGDAASCALVFKPGCPGPDPSCAVLPTNPVPLCPEPSVCPAGQTNVCARPARQANNGKWGTATVCYCASPLAPAAIAQSASNRWGLYLGLGVAALIVFKVATG